MARQTGGIRTALAALVMGLALLAAACGTEATTDDATDTGTISEGDAAIDDDGGEPFDDTPDPDEDEAADGGPDAAPVVNEPPAPVEPAPAKPAPSEPASTADDGTWHAFVTQTDGERMSLDKVEVFTGEARKAAMEADGEAHDETVDGIYVRNRNSKIRTLGLAEEATVRAIDCSAGCTPVAADASALTSKLVEVTVRGGAIVSVTEVYMA